MKLGTRLALIACGAAALSILAAVPAQAAPATTHPAATSERQVVALVLGSSNPAATFASLTAQQRALFMDSQKHLTSTTIVSSGPSGSTTSAPIGPMVVTPNANGCWYRYWYNTWSNFGYTEGDTWTQLNWCGSNGKITSHSLSNVGGKSDDVFFTYNGVVGKPGGLYPVSGHQEWRQVVEFQFTVHVPGFSGTANPCQQTRGGATGLVSTNYSCNLGA